MRIEVLSEDRSGTPLMEALMPRLLAESKRTANYHIRPHRGKGYLPDDSLRRPPKFASGLLELLPAKCRAYEKAKNVDVLLVMLDADRDDPGWLYRSLEATVRRYAPSVSFVFGIAVEEMESWLLGDPAAILAAYPDADMAVIRGYEQDSIVGTWEILCRAVYRDDADAIIEKGYPTVGQYKSEMAARIAPHMNVRMNNSPSYRSFRDTFIRIVGNHDHA